MPRPPNLFTSDGPKAEREPLPDAAGELAASLREIAEIKSKILDPKCISGPRLLGSLAEIANRPSCFKPVDQALEEIIADEKPRAIQSGVNLSYMFQEALMERVHLLNKFSRAPELHVNSLITELTEYGQKDVEGEPQGITKDRAVEALKDVAHHHPEAKPRIAKALAALQ